MPRGCDPVPASLPNEPISPQDPRFTALVDARQAMSRALQEGKPARFRQAFEDYRQKWDHQDPNARQLLVSTLEKMLTLDVP